MNKFLSGVLTFLFFLLFVGCNENNKEKKNNFQKTKREILETFSDGKLKRERIIDLETYQYKEIEYYPSGKKFMEGYFTPTHKRTGKWISWFENGKIRSVIHFINGKTDGKVVVYRENGNLFYEGYFKQGLKEGVWRIYNDSGTLGAEVKYALDTIVYKKNFFDH